MSGLDVSRVAPPVLRNRRPVRLVVVERGAHAVGSCVLPDGSEETIVIRQCGAEPPVELGARSIGRIATLERSGACIGRSIVVLGPRADEESMAARHSISRAIIDRGTSTELVFVVDGDSGTGLRRDVMTLVEALVNESGASSPPIRVRFGASRERHSN